MRALSYPFRLSPGGSLASTTDYNQVVRGQVIDSLMTNQGERVMRPNYGCDVQSALFDPTDELMRRDAASMLKDRLQGFVPRCMVRSVKLDIGVTAPGIPQGVGDPSAVLLSVLYRSNLYSTDQTVAIPVSSEFINRGLRAEYELEEEV